MYYCGSCSWKGSDPKTCGTITLWHGCPLCGMPVYSEEERAYIRQLRPSSYLMRYEVAKRFNIQLIKQRLTEAKIPANVYYIASTVFDVEVMDRDDIFPTEEIIGKYLE